VDTLSRRSRPRPLVQSKKEADQVRAAYRIFETSGDGQTVLQDLADSYYDVSSFVPGDPQSTAFNEGRRAVVLAIFEILEELKQPKQKI